MLTQLILVRPWRKYPVGQELEFPGGMADMLVNRLKVAKYGNIDNPKTDALPNGGSNRRTADGKRGKATP